MGTMTKEEKKRETQLDVCMTRSVCSISQPKHFSVPDSSSPLFSFHPHTLHLIDRSRSLRVVADEPLAQPSLFKPTTYETP